MMAHRKKSLRTFFATLLVVVLAATTATPAGAMATEETEHSTSMWTALRHLWGDVLEWVGVGTARTGTQGAGENGGEGSPSIDPLGNSADGGENEADGGGSFDPLG